MNTITIYVVDSSSLIDFNQRYPVDVFPKLWGNVEKLIKSGSLVAPKEVLKEIVIRDDALTRWARDHKRLFREVDANQIKILRDILQKYPSLANAQKDGPQADPFVIALAIALEKEAQQTLVPTVRKRIIVTEEQLRGNQVKIPYVCKEYGIDCIKVLDMFRSEGWQF